MVESLKKEFNKVRVEIENIEVLAKEPLTKEERHALDLELNLLRSQFAKITDQLILIQKILRAKYNK